MLGDLVERVAAQMGISHQEAGEIVSEFIGILADEIVKYYKKDGNSQPSQVSGIVATKKDVSPRQKMVGTEKRRTIYAPPGWKASENRRLPLDDAHEVHRWDILVTVHDKHVLDDVLDLMKEYTGLSEIVDFIVIPPDEAPLVRIGVQEYVDKEGKSRRILFVMYNR